MRLDRKLLLIAPAIVLACVVAGMIYTAVQLHALSAVSQTFKERDAFISAVERGEKRLTERQALGYIRFSFDVEAKRTAALVAARDLMFVLCGISVAALAVLVAGIRSVPREHWPRMSFGKSSAP